MQPSDRPRILLVEDEATLREHLARSLSDEYFVITAGNGIEALKAVLQATPDLIVTDIVMPEMDGMELLKALRGVSTSQAIPVLLISGYDEESRRIEGFRQGADGYLAKPYNVTELRAVIGSMLLSAQTRRDAARREAIEQAEQEALVERAALLESITDAFFALDRQWRFTYVNRRALDHYRKSDPELLGQSMWDVFPHLRGTVFQQQFESCLREQRSVAFETTSLVMGMWADLRAYPTRQGLAVYFQDVSERKRAEQELRAAEESLRESDRRKDEFLAMLAHELRNPLAPIQTASEVLARTLPADIHARSGSAVDIIKRQTAHLARLVDDLLDVSRITQGRIRLKIEPVNVASVIAQAVETVARQVRQKNQVLSISDSSEPLYVDGDFARLVQCVGNVLANAIKFTDHHGRIGVQLRSEASRAVIEVTDTGAGIAAELLPKVFELFVQSDRTLDRSQGGLGVGLALVKRLIEMHGGLVTARSAGVGHGCAFEIRLPRTAARRSAHAESPAVCAPPRRVLVVDDNQDAAETIAMLLRLQGHDVRAVHTARGALECLQSFSPEVALLDIGLPDMTGYELAIKVRANPQLDGIRLIALTGYGQPEDHQQTQAAGFEDHLVKPVDLCKLERSLGAASSADRKAPPLQ